MKHKPTDNVNTYLDEPREFESKLNLSKFEDDLFHEEDYIPGSIIRVKKIGTPARGEKWKVYQDDILAMTIIGDNLNKKEKEFLYTYEGISFIISQYKNNIIQFSKFKKNLKDLFATKHVAKDS